MLRRAWLLFLFLFVSPWVFGNAPFSLSVKEALEWTPDSAKADTRNVSRVPLVARFEEQQSQLNPKRNPKVKVLIAPDGMDNFGSYLTEQEQFNLYNFTHWAHIDVLNWFAGTADNTVNIPSRPWVDAAHKNGVKVIGSIYLAVAQWGGSAETAQAFLLRDKDGRFPMAHKLVEIADYYGFDGWLMNQETDLSAVKDENNDLLNGVKDYNRAAFLGKEMLAFMTYLNYIAPEHMEIHWYDAQLMDGTVRWQNQLNEHNAPFFGHKYAPVSDAIFLNYWWDQKMVEASHGVAKKLRRDPYEVYTGVDLWPARNAQKAFTETDWLDAIFSDADQQGLTSIALFGNNFNFNFEGTELQPAYSEFNHNPQDYQRFYNAAVRMFAGDSVNVDEADRQKWKGLGYFVPARSVLNSLPFSTRFNTGHGLKKADKGKVISASPWHDMSQQDILPSWQFAVIGSKNITLEYDFDAPYTGGNSIKVLGHTRDEQVELPLFKTRFSSQAKALKVASRGASGTGAQITLMLSDNTTLSFDLTSDQSSWQEQHFPLSLPENAWIQRISLRIAQGEQNLALNLGELALE